VVEIKYGGIITGKVKTAANVNDPVIPIFIKPKETLEKTELEKKTCITIPRSLQAMMCLISPLDELKKEQYMILLFLRKIKL
jgi:hypothetical protein